MARLIRPRGSRVCQINLFRYVRHIAFFVSQYASVNFENAIGYAMHRSRSHHAVIRVYEDAGNAIETDEHKGEFKEL